MNSEEMMKAVEIALETYKNDLDQASKKQKQILENFVDGLEEKKMAEVRKEIAA